MKFLRLIVLFLGFVLVATAGWWLASPLFLNKTVNESFGGVSAGNSPTTAEETKTIEMATAAAMDDTSVADPMPTVNSQPQILGQGLFQNGDEFHQGAGTATLYQLVDGNRILRLEEFQVTNGPDLHVILATNSQPSDAESLGNHIDLGKLKGNIGDQNYTIPADVDLNQYGSVVIYCQPFHVVFATASLNR